MGTRHLGAAAAALALLFTAACSAAEPRAAAPTPSETQPPPTSPSPTLNREATIRAWLKALVDMQNTGDSGPFTGLSAKSCEYCQKFAQRINGIYSSGGHATAGVMEVVAIHPQAGTGKKKYVVMIDGPGGTMRPSAGAAVQEFIGGPATYLVGLKKEREKWAVSSADLLPSLQQ